MKVYLAGPMRGYPEYNYPAFNAAAARLRAAGFEVFNPAETTDEELAAARQATAMPDSDPQKNFTIRDYMRIDTDWICRHADAVALLPGWETSTGARAEKALAECIGAKVLYVGADI